MLHARQPDKGHGAAASLITLMKWGDAHYPNPSGPPRLTVHAGCGGSVDGDLRCDRCQARVGFGAIDIQPGPGMARRQERETGGTPNPPR